MKIFALAPKENWICDRFVLEWNEHYSDVTVNHPKDADIIWLLADWCWNQIHPDLLREKTVVASVHHIVPDKFGESEINEFKTRDQFIDYYHVPCEKTKEQIEGFTKKPIWVMPFWVNSQLWFKIAEDKTVIRSKLGIDPNCFLIGSFQRDTEGSDLISPKLEKGPDLFCDAVERFRDEKAKSGIEVKVLLGGWRRQYVMNRLKAADIKYYYAELPPQNVINAMYNMLDLYIVAARYEGGPQSIVECACTGTPIISTDVGIASLVLNSESIFKPGNELETKTDPEYLRKQVDKYLMPQGFDFFYRMFESIKGKS